LIGTGVSRCQRCPASLHCHLRWSGSGVFTHSAPVAVRHHVIACDGPRGWPQDPHRVKRRHRPNSALCSNAARRGLPTAAGRGTWGAGGAGACCAGSASSGPSSPMTGTTASASPMTSSPFFLRRSALLALCSLLVEPRCPPPPPPGGAPPGEPPAPTGAPGRARAEPGTSVPLPTAATGAPGGDNVACP
jgi:hypothetical protein